MVAKYAHPSPHRACPVLVTGGLLLTGSLLLGGCRPRVPPQGDNSTPPLTAPTPETSAPETSAPEIPEPAPAPAPAVTSAPTTAVSPTVATLPNSLIKEWQPLSNVLLAFGPMTLTADQVRWGSGQTSPYSLVSTEGGYLLRLEANPTFYDTPNRYIKLMPKANTNGASSSIEIAFYTDDAQLQKDEYVMYGSYFAE